MIYIILPAYNEEKNIGRLLSNTLKELNSFKEKYHLVFVNDGSADKTKEEVLKFKDKISLEIIDHSTNRGVGEAFKSGFGRVLSIAGEDDIIVTKEADNTSDLGILKKMLEKLADGNDIVLASCFAREGRIVNSTWDRHLCSTVGNFLLKLFFPINQVNTYSSFYRVYRASVVKKAFEAYDGKLITEEGFACMVEFLVKLSRVTSRIAEVPMMLKADMRAGRSKMKKFNTILAYLKIILKNGILGRLRNSNNRRYHW